MAQSTPNPTKAGTKLPAKAKTGNTGHRMQDPELRRARAMAMIQQRMQSLSREQIAENFNLTATTVDNELKWAKKYGLLEALEDRLLGAIGKKTLLVLESHLDMGSLDAAKEGLKFIIHASQQKARLEERQTDREFGLEDYLREKRLGSLPAEFETLGAPPEGTASFVLQGSPGGPPGGPATPPEDPDRQGPGQDPGLPDAAAGDRARSADADSEHPAGLEE